MYIYILSLVLVIIIRKTASILHCKLNMHFLFIASESKININDQKYVGRTFITLIIIHPISRHTSLRHHERSTLPSPYHPSYTYTNIQCAQETMSTVNNKQQDHPNKHPSITHVTEACGGGSERTT